MKMKYIMAIGAFGSTLTIVPLCTSVSAITNSPQMDPPTTAPAMPATAEWDGSEYVGEVNGTYYYQGPNNTWYALDQDPARQQRFEEWQKNQQSSEQNTRSQGTAKGLNASAQTGQMQNTGNQGAEMGRGATWNNPSGQSGEIRNTRYQGHDMGQTHPIAPPVETH